MLGAQTARRSRREATPSVRTSGDPARIEGSTPAGPDDSKNHGRRERVVTPVNALGAVDAEDGRCRSWNCSPALRGQGATECFPGQPGHMPVQAEILRGCGGPRESPMVKRAPDRQPTLSTWRSSRGSIPHRPRTLPLLSHANGDDSRAPSGFKAGAAVVDLPRIGCYGPCDQGGNDGDQRMTGGAWVLFAAGWLGHWLWCRRYDLGEWLRDPDPLPSDRDPLPALRSVRIVRRDEGE